MKRLLAAALVVCLSWSGRAVAAPVQGEPSAVQGELVEPSAVQPSKAGSKAPPTPEDALNEARQAFRAASRAYEERRYQEALAGFQTAFRRAPLPAFLFNVGQCHRMLNRPAEALSAYSRYLETSPEPPPNVELTRELMAEMEGRLAWQKRTEQELRSRLAEELRPVLQQELEQRYEAVLQEKLAASLRAGAAEQRSPVQGAQALQPLHRRWYFWAGVGGFLVASGASMMVLQDVTRRDARR